MVKVDIKKSFGASAKIWRTRLGISQEELAERAGLHRTYVSDVERGARNVSLENINRLAHALEISIFSFFLPTEGEMSSRLAEAPISTGSLVDILFVEDNPDDIELTMRALKDAHITNRVYVVRDGAAALDFLFCKGDFSHRRRKDRPQMILLDLGLPKIDGLAVLRRVKRDPQMRSIPVVVLTGSKYDRDIITSKRLGAEAYIVKPFDFQSLSEVTPRLSLQWALLKPPPVRNA